MDKMQSLTALSALSQSTRLDVFRLLIQAGEAGLAAGEIAQRLDVKQNTMSANLSILAASNLITGARDGRRVRYCANMAAMQGLLSFLMEDCCGGHPDLCRPVLDEICCG